MTPACKGSPSSRETDVVMGSYHMVWKGIGSCDLGAPWRHLAQKGYNVQNIVGVFIVTEL